MGNKPEFTHPSKRGDRPVIEVILVKESAHPDGHYVIVDEGTTNPKEGVPQMAASFAPQMVYLEARAAGKSHTLAMAAASDKVKVEAYLAKAEKFAQVTQELKDIYNGKKKKKEEDEKKDDEDQNKDDEDEKNDN